MRWKSGRRSQNIEDRRGMPVRRGGIKLSGTMIVIVVAIGLFTGQDPLTMLKFATQLSQESSATVSQPPALTSEQSQQADFVAVILADTEDTWGQLLPGYGLQYQQPKLVLFTNQVQSACGLNSSAVGPFYCPGDNKVYLDLGFFTVLENQLGAQGDFARAYVIGHEIGHHIQNLQGTSAKVHEMQGQLSKADANALSVKLELQADCYAGVWAHHAHKNRAILEAGDKEEGLHAAASIGDDRLLKRAGQQVRPDAFTHGTSKQRVFWLRKGLDSGAMSDCNTFK